MIYMFVQVKNMISILNMHSIVIAISSAISLDDYSIYSIAIIVSSSVVIAMIIGSIVYLIGNLIYKTRRYALPYAMA